MRTFRLIMQRTLLLLSCLLLFGGWTHRHAPILQLSGGVDRGPEPALEGREAMGRKRVVLLHTNDIHASFLPGQASWLAEHPLVGGFEMLAAHVEAIRAEEPAVLLLDSGDLSTGHPLGQLLVEGARGWGLFQLMNVAGYDAWTLGNHDFDLGQANLHLLLSRLTFPTVVSNLEIEGPSPLAGDVLPSIVKSVGGVRVGIIGVMTPELSTLVAAGQLNGVTVRSPTEAVSSVVTALDPITDLIVVLSHLGDEDDVILAREVTGIDVILGGHSHRRITTPLVEGKTLIVQSGSNLQNLGRLDLEIARDEVVKYRFSLISLKVDPALTVPEPMRKAVEGAKHLVEAEYSVQIGRLITPWRRQYNQESNIGNWLTDQLRLKAGTDLAFLNAGGIRADLPAGPVTRGDLMTVLPFDNVICLASLTGAELERLLKANAEAAVGESHGILQVSGVSYRYQLKGQEVIVRDILVGGTPLEKERNYSLATNDYLLFSQPQKYFPGITLQDARRTSLSVIDVMVEAMTAIQEVDSRVDGRISEIKEGL